MEKTAKISFTFFQKITTHHDETNDNDNNNNNKYFGGSSQQQQHQQLVAWPPIVPSSFDKLDPNRKDQVFLYYEKDVVVNKNNKTTRESSSSLDNYRYKLTIIDRSITTNTTTTQQLAYATVVFIIPAGRETEYIFSSKHGLQTIAASASTARLIAVSFGRNQNHVFINQQTVQDELTYLVQILARHGSFLNSKLSSSSSIITTNNDNMIPFMTLNGIGQRNVIAEGISDVSGPYLVEQVQIDDNQQVVLRRLYFMNNPFVIQTEVFMLIDNNNGSTTSDNNNETTTSNSSYNNLVDKSRAAFDYHKIITAGIMTLSSLLFSHTVSTANNSIDVSSSSLSSLQHQRGLLIGLGGGGLVNYMSYVWPPSSDNACTLLTAIELDPTMVDIATKYFGLVVSCSGNDDAGGVSLNVRIGNGLDITVARGAAAAAADDDNDTNNKATTTAAANDDDPDDDDPKPGVPAAVAADATDEDPTATSELLSFAPGSMSFIIIDVDSKDNSKGMSCPPQEFIEIDYLQRLSQLLLLVNDNNDEEDGTTTSSIVDDGGGVLAINVSARDPEMLQLVCRNVRQVFNTVILSSNNATGGSAAANNMQDEESEDVNVVVFAKNISLTVQNDDADDNNNNILSDRNLLSNRLVKILQRNPNINDECISDLTSPIQDFSMWHDNNENDDSKSSRRVKKAGGGGGKKKPNKKKKNRGKKK